MHELRAHAVAEEIGTYDRRVVVDVAARARVAQWLEFSEMSRVAREWRNRRARLSTMPSTSRLLRMISLTALFSLSTEACAGVTFGPDGAAGPSGGGGDEVVDETAVAGANQNDRSASKDGEPLLTGAMVVSPSGRFVVMQRNTLTLVFDVETRTYHEISVPLTRVAFATSSDTVFAITGGGQLEALDLATRTVLWTIPLSNASTLLRVSPDESALLASDAESLRVIDAKTGAVRSATGLGVSVTYAAFVPGQARALVVLPTTWKDKGPHTPVLAIDLSGKGELTRTDVPNCEGPIFVAPNGARAFLSPTYCSPGAKAVPGETWTNPDPVSVIELDAGVRFRENLPGFGPVALSGDGRRLVAYLDVKRMDAGMFRDPKQVPWVDGPRYHLMTIDPVALTFQLAPIGNAIPRFALTNDGRGLLVDASAKIRSRTKIAARATASIGADGITTTVETNLDVFGSSSAFGYFDLGSQSFRAFSGPVAPLDRFVQLAGGRYVVTLGKRADGLGGIPYRIDLSAGTTTQLLGDFGSGVRDVGLAPDGATALVRLRLPANLHDGGFYSREGLCLSADGTCGASLDATYEASVPFAAVPPPSAPTPTDEACPGGHDCF